MSDFPFILHHGGKEGVTGSCHELRVSPDAGILIDCGLFQGTESQRSAAQGPEQSTGASPESRLPVDFPVEHIRALVVTHVHIDHIGRIPYLLAAGFTGPIFCSEPSAILLSLMLEDAFKVGISRDRRLIEEFLGRIKKQTHALPYGIWHRVDSGDKAKLDIKLKPAGHILGSAYVECRIRPLSRVNVPFSETQGKDLMKKDAARDLRIIFSGDLGAPYAPLLPAPKSPYRADVLVLESTYGDRLHENRKARRERLLGVIEHALVDRGAVLIPAFALGRTQELLYELEEIIHRYREHPAAKGVPWDDLEIIVDSPLANRLTEAYRQLRPFWDAEARKRVGSGRRPLGFEQMTVVESHADHESAVLHLQKHGRPCIVIAAGGMCSGGRIVNYLKALLGDPRTDVLFIGYQARGTPGRAIQEFGPRGGYVVLEGRRYDIRARIHTIGGYSAHADKKNLVDFVRRMRYKPAEIRLVHGEPEARMALGEALEKISGSILI